MRILFRADDAPIYGAPPGGYAMLNETGAGEAWLRYLAGLERGAAEALAAAPPPAERVPALLNAYTAVWGRIDPALHPVWPPPPAPPALEEAAPTTNVPRGDARARRTRELVEQRALAAARGEYPPTHAQLDVMMDKLLRDPLLDPLWVEKYREVEAIRRVTECVPAGRSTLGRWVERQVSEYGIVVGDLSKKASGYGGVMLPAQALALEAMPGWVWAR